MDIRKIINYSYKYLLTVFCSIYGLTIGLFSAKGRQFIVKILDSFFSVYSGLPVINSNEVISNERLSLTNLHGKDGNVSISELAIICGIIKKENPLNIFEIGTFTGRTTVNMALNSEENARIYTLDLKKEDLENVRFNTDSYDKKLIEKEIIGENFLNRENILVKKIIQLYGDSAAFDFTPYYNIIDFVFIDGAHNYKTVLSDSENAYRIIRSRSGIILWHDYRNKNEVVKAIKSFKKKFKISNIYLIEGTTLAYCKLNNNK